MKSFTRKPLMGLVALLVLTVGCTLPLAPTPTPFVFPTPNMTLTALFMIPPTSTVPAGPTTPPASAATATSVPCTGTNLADFVSETIPDGTAFTPGAAFTKTWTLKNAGTCTWSTGYSLVFDSGSQMGAPASVPLTAAVAPGATVTLSAAMTAPSTVGSYQGSWKLATPAGTRFGVGTGGTTAFWVKIYAGTPPPAVPACVVPSPVRRPDGNGSMVEAYWTTNPPAIDGYFDSFAEEWPATLKYSATSVVFGKSQWDNDADLSATYHFKWDGTYLYLAAKVRDNNYVQESSGSNLYNGDSLEILFDTALRSDYCTSSLSGDDFQLGVSGGFLVAPGGQEPEAYLWYPSDKTGLKPVATVKAVQISAPGFVGYQIEARIPWTIFSITPTGGEEYGFAFSVSDNDSGGTSKQQSMVSSDPKRVLTNPMTWGTIQMETELGP
jgi:hypothetical protein